MTKNDCIERRSPLDSNICVAKLCLSICGWIGCMPNEIEIFSKRCCIALTVILTYLFVKRMLGSEGISLFSIHSFIALIANSPTGIRSLFPFPRTLKEKFIQMGKYLHLLLLLLSIHGNIEVQEMLYHESHTYF